MSSKNKGFMYYELVMGLMILLFISSSLLSYISNLSINIENQKLTNKMKQNLILNIILLENNEDLVNDSTYRLDLEGDNLCIMWRDLYGEEKTICEKVWI